MSFSEKLDLKEMAEEDIYFARRDKEWIDAMHRRRLAEYAGCRDETAREKARAYEQAFAEITRRHQASPRHLGKAYRHLLDRVLEACRLKHGG